MISRYKVPFVRKKNLTIVAVMLDLRSAESSCPQHPTTGLRFSIVAIPKCLMELPLPSSIELVRYRLFLSLSVWWKDFAGNLSLRWKHSSNRRSFIYFIIGPFKAEKYNLRYLTLWLTSVFTLIYHRPYQLFEIRPCGSFRNIFIQDIFGSYFLDVRLYFTCLHERGRKIFVRTVVSWDVFLFAFV